MLERARIILENICIHRCFRFFSNQYYHDTPILKEEDAAVLKYRLALISVVARTLRSAMGLLGIELPERM